MLPDEVVALPSAFVQAGQDIRIGGRASAAQYQYTIQGESLDDLVEWGPKLLQEMRGSTDIHSAQVIQL